MKRERLVHTFGVLLAGLFEAEKHAQELAAERRRHASGIYPRPSEPLRNPRSGTTEPPTAELSEPPPAF